MAYVDSSGKTHVSLSEASRGHAAQTTASRNAAGQVVGSSSGSNYARAQEAAREAAEAEKQSKYSSMVEYDSTPAWMTAPGETAGIDRSQLQKFRTVDQKSNVWNKAKGTLVDVWNQSNKAAVEIIGLNPEQLSNAENARKTQVALSHNPENDIQVYSAGKRSITGLANQGVHDFLTTQRNEVAEKPLNFGGSIALSLGAGYVGGALLSGGGMVARTGLVKVGLPKVAGVVEPGVNIVLGAAVIKEATELKSVEEGLTFGKDLLFMGAGYKAGQTRGVKAFDTLRTVRAKEIPVESLVKKDVLSGKEQFPLTEKGANAQDIINSYKDPLSGEFTGYHATTDSFNTKKPIHSEVNRPTDVPGMYVSPLQEGASPHFLRLSSGKVSNLKYASQGLTEIKIGLKETNIDKIKSGSKKIEESLIGTSRPLEPNVMKITLSNVERLPESSRFNPSEAQKYLLSDEAPKGTAFLTPVLESTVKTGGRAEAEAIIVPETHLEKLSTEKSFFEWNSRKVELKEYKTVESESFKTDFFESKNNDLVTAEDLLKSYSYEAPEVKGLMSDFSVPLRSSSFVVDPLRSTSSVVDPLRSSSSLVDPLRSTSSVVDPLRSSSSLVDPLRSTSSVVDPLRSTSSVVDPLRSTSSVVDPLRSSSSVVDPLRDSRYTPDQYRYDRIVDPFRDTGYTPDSTPDPFRYDPPRKGKPLTPEDFSLEIEPLEQPRNLRKTKKKMLRNTYGDPLNIKLKL